MTDIRNLLLVDKNPAHAEAFREAVLNAKDGPFHGEWVQTLSQSVERLRRKTIWAIFASLSLPDSQGLDTIDKLLQVAPGVPILVMGGAQDEDLSTEALRRGAKDYLLIRKDVQTKDLQVFTDSAFCSQNVIRINVLR